MEALVAVRNSPMIMSLPMPDGSMLNFRVVESPIMEQGLADKWPEIKTYMGQGIEDPTATTRFDWTIWGFHAIIIKPEGYIFIEPNIRGNVDQYISYYQNDLPVELNQKFCDIQTGLPIGNRTDLNELASG